jgi:hypothetical protein
MKFIDYNALKEFYTIRETCALFEMSKDALKVKSDEYGISPSRNELGEAGFPKYDIRRLHNKLYYEEREHQEAWDPWA